MIFKNIRGACRRLEEGPKHRSSVNQKRVLWQLAVQLNLKPRAVCGKEVVRENIIVI